MIGLLTIIVVHQNSPLQSTLFVLVKE